MGAIDDDVLWTGTASVVEFSCGALIRAGAQTEDTVPLGPGLGAAMDPGIP